MKHDCTKCYKPVRKDDLVERFGLIYHTKCAWEKKPKKSVQSSSTKGYSKTMNTFPMILDGSKFSWHANGASVCDGIGRVADHPGFPKSGRAPKQVAVRSHKTGWIVVFNFVDIADDGEGSVALNYQGTLPDGRCCALALVAD